MGEDFDNFAFFGIDEVTQFVVGGKNLGRFDEDCLTCGGLVVDETLEAAFELCLHGDAETAVADVTAFPTDNASFYLVVFDVEN